MTAASTLASHFKFDQLDAEYRQAEPSLSQTYLKNLLAKSPAHAQESAKNHVDTAAMKLGRGAHTRILEPAAFGPRYAQAPECDRRTKDGKAIWAEFQASVGDKEIVTATDMQTIADLAKAVESHDLAKDLFTGGKAEVSAFGQINGVNIKGRFDYFFPDDGVIIDLKTCLDASPSAVKKYIVNYGLHIQQYVYSELHRSITGNKPADFVFVMVEKSPPFGVAVFRLKPEAVELAKDEVHRALDIYQECQASGLWPAYPATVQEIDLPAWYYSQKEKVA